VTENAKIGIIIFSAMAVGVLAVLRFTRHQHAIRDRVKYPLIVIFLLAALFDLLYALDISLPRMLEPYYYALLYLAIAVLAIRLSLLFFFDYFLFHRKKYHAPRLLKEISGVVLFTLAVVIIIQDTLKIQVTTVLATSAIITVVLGLALQETLGNLFAGLALHLEPPYTAGDWVRVGDIVGRVVEVTWRATKLRTVNNDFIIIPNGQVAKERVMNYSYPRTPHATNVHVGVSYAVPPNKVAKVIHEALANVDNVTLEPLPDVRVSAFQDFSIDYQIKFYFKDFGLIDPTVAAVRKAIWYHFRRNGIEIPFPIRNIYIHERAELQAVREEKLQRLSESLRKVYVFSSLAEDERRLIAEHSVEMHFAEKELILHEGEAGDSFYIIDEGEVEVFLTSGHGSRKVLGRLKEGDFFGEIALLTGEKRSASVEALSDVRVYRLDKENFKDILESKPDILDEIGSLLCKRKDQLAELMEESSGEHGEAMSMNVNEAKSRILSRIRNYFGL